MLITCHDNKEFMVAMKIVACALPIPLLLALFVDYDFVYLAFPIALVVGLYFYYKVEVKGVWESGSLRVKEAQEVSEQ